MDKHATFLKAIFVLIGIFVLTISASANETSKPRLRYYRQHNATKPTPRQSGAVDVVNAASFLPGISPGGLATVFGENLTDVSGVVVANTNPLPARLAGVEVDVNGVPAPIFSIAHTNGEDQISLQVPYGTDTAQMLPKSTYTITAIWWAALLRTLLLRIRESLRMAVTLMRWRNGASMVP